MGFGKDGKGQIIYDQVTISLGTLAAKDVIAGAIHTSLENAFRILKTEYFITWDGVTVADADGPILVGMSAGGLSAAEIEEAIEADPTGSFDRPAIEESNRPVWPVALLNQALEGGMLQAKGSFNPRWTMPETIGWSWWVYNLENAALTTGSAVIVFAKNFGVWVQ